MLHSRIRVEEKMLLDEFKKKGIDIVQIHDDDLILWLQNPEQFKNFDVVFSRSISHLRSYYILETLDAWGIKTVNTPQVVRICGDKILTSIALVKANVPTTNIKIAFEGQATLTAIEEMGYPVVMKPAFGSWGRLVSKINDRHAAESLIEHKEVLGSLHHSTFYIQEYINKTKGRDIRAFVIGDETICAIYRTSEHWITNTARGGQASNCEVTKELNDICVKAAKAVGGGIVAIDVFETEKGYLINEINHTMEFRNSVTTTGVNIPEKMVEYVLNQVN